MRIPISSIVIKERVRKDLGELGPLMASMERYGQLNPVVVTRGGELVAGHRRLESARRLGWSTIAAVHVDKVTEADKLEMELDENVHRKDLLPAELVEGYLRLERLRKPTWRDRIRSFFSGLWGKLFRRKPAEERRVPSVEDEAQTYGVEAGR